MFSSYWCWPYDYFYDKNIYDCTAVGFRPFGDLKFDKNYFFIG